MKQFVIGIGFFMIVILTTSIVMAQGIELIEKNNLEQSVEVAIYQSLQEGIENQIDPSELFEQNLNVLLSGENYSVHVIASDYEKGILSVNVEKSYNNFGNVRTISTERTVIYEREAE